MTLFPPGPAVLYPKDIITCDVSQEGPASAPLARKENTGKDRQENPFQPSPVYPGAAKYGFILLRARSMALSHSTPRKEAS
ncbi:MAG TPA: hypothetical protein DCY12_05455 [Candidatus Atribacteria bacterium]|nr:hypothetical protein [Candidatus Atribacteria bacterium]